MYKKKNKNPNQNQHDEWKIEHTSNLHSPSNSQTYISTFYTYICAHTQRHKMEGGEPGSQETITFYIIRYRHDHTQYDIWDVCQHTTNLLPINDEAKLLWFKLPPRHQNDWSPSSVTCNRKASGGSKQGSYQQNRALIFSITGFNLNEDFSHSTWSQPKPSPVGFGRSQAKRHVPVPVGWASADGQRAQPWCPGKTSPWHQEGARFWAGSCYLCTCTGNKKGCWCVAPAEASFPSLWLTIVGVTLRYCFSLSHHDRRVPLESLWYLFRHALSSLPPKCNLLPPSAPSVPVKQSTSFHQLSPNYTSGFPKQGKQKRPCHTGVNST